jgi:hypothetical protein
VSCQDIVLKVKVTLGYLAVNRAAVSRRLGLSAQLQTVKFPESSAAVGAAVATGALVATAVATGATGAVVGTAGAAVGAAVAGGVQAARILEAATADAPRPVTLRKSRRLIFFSLLVDIDSLLFD